jgi:hypothetical protein
MSVFNATEQIRKLEVYNQNAAAVPSWGVARVVSVDPNTGIITVDQPNADNMTAVLFNGPVAIPATSYGTANWDFPNWAAYNASDGTPNPGDQWGTGNGSWLLRKNKTGFIIWGVDSNNTRALVTPAGGGGGSSEASFWARLIGEPGAVALTASTGGSIPDWGAYYLWFTYTFPTSAGGDLVAMNGGLQAIAIATGTNSGKITINPAMMGPNPGNGCTGWKCWMAVHADCGSPSGIYSLVCDTYYLAAQGSDFSTTVPITSLGFAPPCGGSAASSPPYSYSWYEVDSDPDGISAHDDTLYSNYMAGLRQKVGGRSGNAWGTNPAFEIGGSLQAYASSIRIGGNVIVRLRPGKNNTSKSQIGQEYIFIGGATGSVARVVNVGCDTNGNAIYYYLTDYLNNGRIVTVC